MAWLNLNNSINSLKGQITNLATDLLSEGIIQSTETPEGNPTTENEERVQELENIVCAQQDEIDTLRKQNEELAKKLRKNNDLHATKQDFQFGDEWTMFDESEINFNNDGNNYVTSTLISPQDDITADDSTDELLPSTIKSKLQDIQNEINVNNATIDKLNCEIYKNRVDQLISTDTYQRIFELQKKNEHLLERKCRITSKECETHERKCRELDKVIKNLEGTRNTVKNDSNTTAGHESKLQKLEEENKKLLSQQDEVAKHFDELYQQNKKLTRENEELVANLNQLDQDCQQTTERLVTLRDTLQVDFNKMRTDYDELSQKNSDLEKELQIMSTEKGDFEAKLNELKTVEKNYAECMAKISYIENVNEKLNENLVTLSANNQELQMKNSQLLEIEKQYNELRAELENKPITDNKDHEKELSDMTTKFENTLTISLRYKNQLSDIFSTLNRNFKTQFTLNQPETAGFTSQINELESKLTAMNDESETKIQSLEQQLKKVAEEKNTAVEEQKQSIVDLNLQLKQTSDELKKVKNDLDFYKSECDQLRKNNENLFEDLKLLNQSMNLETIPETNEEYLVKLETQLEDAQQQIQVLQTPKHEAKPVEDDAHTRELLTRLAQFEQANKDLSNEKIALEESLALLKTECANANNASADKSRQLETWQDQVKALEEKLMGVELEKAAMEDITPTSTRDDTYISELLSHIGKFEQANRDLSREKIALEENLTLLKTECANAKHAVAEKSKQMENLQDHIKSLDEKLQGAKLNETTIKLQLDTYKKELENSWELKNENEKKMNDMVAEINRLRQEQEYWQEKFTVITNENNELKSAIKAASEKQSETSENEDRLKIYREKELSLLENIKQLENTLNSEKEKNIKNTEHLQRIIDELGQKLQASTGDFEKLKHDFEELMKIVNVKHNENIAYHGEIQRLNGVIIEEKRKCEEMRNMTSSNTTEITAELNQKVTQIEELIDKNNFLAEKCDILTKNLLEEQSKYHSLSVEHQNSAETIASLRKELERLREHLLQVEEVHAQEMLTSEQKRKEMSSQIMEMEQRERDNSTIYTSVSIRANQQVETLQKQIQLANQQRDEYQARLSESEDKQLKQLAALTNLQCVLEQFQKDKEKEIEEATLVIRTQLLDEQNSKQLLRNEIELLKSQLAETKQGLKAASRLQEQLEKARHQVCSYKDEVEKLNGKMIAVEKLSNELTSQSENKVDKTLVKNLFLGYMTTSTNPQYNRDVSKIVNIIGSVLDFSKSDYEKVNHQGGGSWIQSILKPTSTPNESQTSLSEAFIKFLESESRPKPAPPLLLVNPTSRKNSTDVNPNIQATTNATATVNPPAQTSLLLNEVLLPTFEDFAHTRSSSSILKDVLNNK